MFLTIPTDEELELRTARLILEPITVTHAPELYELLQDSSLHEFVPLDAPTTEEQRERCTKWAKRTSPDGTEVWLNWAARHKDLIIGHFQAGIKKDLIANVAYVVAKSFQGKKFATEAMEAIFKLLHQKFHVQEVRAWVDTRNNASLRLAQKLGMVEIDFIKDADFFKGETSDECVFSLSLGDLES